MLELLLLPNPIMFLNIKNPILRQLEAFTLLHVRSADSILVLYTGAFVPSLEKGPELIHCSSKVVSVQTLRQQHSPRRSPLQKSQWPLGFSGRVFLAPPLHLELSSWRTPVAVHQFYHPGDLYAHRGGMRKSQACLEIQNSVVAESSQSYKEPARNVFLCLFFKFTGCCKVG